MTLVRRLRQRFLRTPISPFYLARRAIEQALRDHATYVRGVVLDIGCGHKPYAALFQCERYVGLDLPSSVARSRVVDVYASGLALPFADSTFESVVSSEVLEHVPQPATLLGEIRRVLKPGGHLLLTTPQTWGLHEEPHDYFRYTRYGLTALATSVGLEVIVVQPTSGFWVTWAARTADFLFLRHAYNRGLLREAVFGVGVAVIQVVGRLLDWAYRGRGDTLDNLLVARRPA